MYKSLFIKVFVFVFCVAIISGCGGIKSGGMKSANSLFETFYVGEGGTQYYIKPIKLKNDFDGELRIDFTFRYNNIDKDSAIVNISVLSNEIIKNIDSLAVSNSNNSVVINDVRLLFAERYKKIFKCRFTMKCSFAEMESLFDDSNWQISTNRGESVVNYIATNKAKKSILKLEDVVFILF